MLIACLAGEFGSWTNACSRRSTYPPTDGFCAAGMELSDIYRGPDGSSVIPLTQEELAEFAGAARGTVNRVLREEQARGTIQLQRGKTRILNPEELARRAR